MNNRRTLAARVLHYLEHAYRFPFLGTVGQLFIAEARMRGIKVGNEVAFFGRPILQIYPGSTVTIGHHAVLVSNSRRCSTANLYSPCRLQTDNVTSRIHIGSGAGLNGASIWCRSTSVTLGVNVALGPNVTIMDSPAHRVWPPESRNYYPGVELDKSVSIGDQVWVGNGSLILAGANIGSNSVIAARSVVTGDIPSNSLAGGIPARVLRSLG